MTAHTEPPVDHDDADYPVMPDCISADGFTPSLPTLLNRPPDTDAQSVSDVESISTGETVSDAADDYDEITYSEIPALAHAARAHFQEDELSDEDMERIMMSDRTIIPDTPTLAQRMPQLPSESTDNTAMPDDVCIKGLYMADKPYQLPDRPLRLMLVADSHTSNEVVASIVSKVVVSITRNPADKTAILNAASQAHHDDDCLGSLDDLSIPVQVSHVIEYRPLDRTKTVKLKGGATTNLQDLVPDLAILYRSSHEDFPFLTPFAMDLSGHKTPMLELAEKVLAPPTKEGPGSCTLTHTSQGDRSLRLSLISAKDENQDEASSTDVPMTMKTFMYSIEDVKLSRHLAYISNYAAPGVVEPVKVSNQGERAAFDVWSLINFPLARYMFKGIVGLLTIFLSVTLFSRLVQPLDPMTDLAVRTPILQLALNNSGLATVNASDVLRYPTTTTVIGTMTSTGVAFPTAATVHVVKADQLLVSFPDPSWKSVQIGVFKNGKALSNVNNTSLINGVVYLSLPSSDAHGQVQISILHDTNPLQNETIKVDLGNRLLQRVTYEKAAKGVQQDVSSVQNAARSFQAKVKSDVQAAFNQSVCSVKSLGNDVLGGLKSTGNALGAASNRTSSGFFYVGELTYNTSSTVGAFIKSAIPQKRHVLRAQKNLRKIRARIVGRKLVVKQDDAISKPGSLSQALSSLRSKVGELQGYLKPGFQATKKSGHPGSAVKTSTKIPLASTKTKASLKSSTTATKKSKQDLPSTDRGRSVQGSQVHGVKKVGST